MLDTGMYHVMAKYSIREQPISGQRALACFSCVGSQFWAFFFCFLVRDEKPGELVCQGVLKEDAREELET